MIAQAGIFWQDIFTYLLKANTGKDLSTQKIFQLRLRQTFFYHEATKTTKDFFYEKIQKTKFFTLKAVRQVCVLRALCGKLFDFGLSRLGLLKRYLQRKRSRKNFCSFKFFNKII
jgi:hypothetical protein